MGRDLSYVSPFFIVASIKASVSFYVDKLGFEVRYIGPDEDPFFAIVGRDHVSIMLKAVAIDVKPIPNHTRHEWARWDAYISTAEPDTLFEEYRSAGVAFRQPVHDDKDGLRGFEVMDADGYVVFFGRPRDSGRPMGSGRPMDSETLFRSSFTDNILRYLIEENFPRIVKCLEMLTEEQIWYRPNPESNSVGNLVVHLAGNLTQWVMDGIGGVKFKRARQAEFDADRTKTKSELIELVNHLKNDLYPIIQNVSAAELLRVRPVQIYEQNGMSILIHVTEHFSYHTGQIAYLTKWLTGQQTNFYGSVPLE